jgi:hypothetical protein
VDGNRNVAYLWNDDNGRNLNLNWIDNDWNGNYRFLAVRKFLRVFLNALILWMGVVSFAVFLPVSEVFSNFVQGNGQGCIFFMIQASYFPRNLHEEFKKIQFCCRSYDQRIFLIRSGIPGQKYEFNQIGKQGIDLGTQ